MNRDTTWYRRIVSFLTLRGSASAERAAVVPNSWLPVSSEQKRWVLGSSTERHNRAFLAS
jgi:hypothetical protein